MVRRLRMALLASSALGMAPFLASLPAVAADATWLANPGSGNFGTGANWSTGAKPANTAFFGASATTAITFSAVTVLDGFTFNAGAPAYTFTSSAIVDILGAGFVMNGGSVAVTNNTGGRMYFENNSTAANITVTNTGASTGVTFLANSDAATATFINNNLGSITFSGTSTANQATITNNAGGLMQMNGNGSLGSATITSAGTMVFSDDSTASNATITNSGQMRFGDRSTAGNAAITNNAGGLIDVSGLTGTQQISAGSIGGGGRIYLGASELTIGSNGLSTAISGVISDCGTSPNCQATLLGRPSTGGSLVKTGTGTLTLSGANTYTGATTVDGGVLNISGSIASSTVTNNATLQYIDTATAGSASITNNNGGNLGFSNTSTAGSATITNNNGGSLNFYDTSTAASATIANNTGGNLYFYGFSTAGSAGITNAGNLNFFGTAGGATIGNDGTLTFQGNATAGSATINNNGVATLSFNDSSTAGSANITNAASMYFYDTSSAGSATVTNNGWMQFNNTSTAGSATVTNNNRLYFTANSSAGSATITSTNDLQFLNTSTAGTATITSNSSIVFNETASAGNATITNNGGSVAFRTGSTAGSAHITNSTTAGDISFYDNSTAGNATIVNNRDLNFNGSSTAGNATITNNSILFFNGGNTTAGSATIFNNDLVLMTGTSTLGNATVTNNSTGNFQFAGPSTAGNGTTFNNGELGFFGTSTGANAAITNGASGHTDFSRSNGPLGDNKLSAGSLNGGGTFTLGLNELTVGGNNLSTNVTGVIADGGSGGGTGASLVKTGTGTMTLSGANTYTGGTTFAAGAIGVSSDANLGDAAGGLTFKGGALQVTGTTFSSTARTITWGTGGGTFDIANAANNFTVSQTLNGGQLTKSGAGTLTLAAANTFTGGLTMNGGTLNLGATTQTTGTLTLNGGTIANGTLTGTAFNTQSGTISAVLAGSGALTQSGAGTATLSGTNTYTGATTVNGGTLAVNGSILASSGVTVNSGGTLAGTGTVHNALISGGTFMAGDGTAASSMTVNGTLGFNAAASYLVNVNPATASFANVSGAATLGGATVNASFAAGSYISKQYTILTAGSIVGTFGAVTNTNLPANFHDSLSYDATHAYLNLDLTFTTPAAGTINGNQNNVANSLINYFNSNGGIPLVFATLSAPALSQASGQPGASTSQAGFAATGQFINGVFDGAFGDNGQGGAIGFAADDDAANAYAAKRKVSREAKDAYAAVTPRDRLAPAFNARWNVWASVYGGNSRVNGDAAAGTNTTTSRIFGTVAGASYRFTPNTLAGFALGGAGSSFDVANGFGGGRADVFNAAVYAKHNIGAAYLAGLLGYSWQDTSTDRTVTISGTDKLHASFKAQALAARLEGGWRYATPAVGITPYAALQTTTFYLPSYGESATSGSSTFALSYASKTVTATRGELGARFDKAMLVQGGVFTLKARTAWAHDWNTDRSAIATFQTLPGATFTTNGAQPSANAALLSLGGEMGWHNGWTVAANFDGEFSRTTAGYAGKGSVRYAW